MYSVYIIKSNKTERHYIGYTNNLSQRLRYHNSGKNKSTRGGAPWVLVWQEDFLNKKDAWLRERQIKGYKGGAAFKNLIDQGGVAEWPKAAHC